MVNNKKVKSAVSRWANLVGHKEALKRFMAEDLSHGISSALINGTYEHEIRPDTEKKIRRALNGPNRRFFKG